MATVTLFKTKRNSTKSSTFNFDVTTSISRLHIDFYEPHRKSLTIECKNPKKLWKFESENNRYFTIDDPPRGQFTASVVATRKLFFSDFTLCLSYASCSVPPSSP